MLLLCGLLILYIEIVGNKNICYLNMLGVSVVFLDLEFKLIEIYGFFFFLRIVRKII